MHLSRSAKVGIMLGAVLIALLVWNRSGIMSLLTLSKRGKKLTTTSVDPSGKVPLSPDAYRKEAEKNLGRAIDPNAFALALMLSAEGLSDNLLSRRIRSWIAFNDLRDLRKAFGWPDFTRLFTFSQNKGQNGFFGEQEKGRRYATGRGLYEGVLKDAETLIKEFESGEDPTNGATKFVDLNALGIQPGTKGMTLASIEKRWGLKGREVVGGNGDLYIFGGKATA
jgi:hypothetical protein